MPPFICEVFDQATCYGRLIRLGINIQTVVQSGPIEVRSILYEGRLCTLARTTLSDGYLEMFVRERPGTDTNIVASHVVDLNRSE